MYSARTEGISAEAHLLKLRSLIREYRPSCVVIDPLTAIAKAGTLGAARAVANRLIYMIKDEGITLFVTALSESDEVQAESTDLQISTIADTWIHLSYLVRSGERNRALTIIKSRGTAHSNQVRELVLSSSGPTLTDVYSAGGEVLMGTLRWEKEAEESASKARQPRGIRRKSAADCSLPKPAPAPGSRPCRWICSGNAPSWLPTPVRMTCAPSPRATGRSELRRRRSADPADARPPRKRGNGAAK